MIRIYEYNQVGDAEIFARQEKKQDVSGAVSRIIADVRQNGDDALKRYGQEFDNAELQTLEVSAEERAAALAAVDADFLEILREAAAHIRAFHEKQKRQDFVVAEREGVLLGQRHIPLERVGLYVPGGTASYPSTVLMDCIPAKIAGVGRSLASLPSIRIRPDVGSKKRQTRLTKVDFPAPVSPTMATLVPWGTWRLKCSSTYSSPSGY